MRLLRRAIRKLILEADLGQQVWSQRAPRKSRHRGIEEDTEIESRMFKALFDWLEDEDASGFKDPVVAQAYIDASQNSKYNDVITTDTTVGEFPDVVYRGLAVSRSVLRDYVGLTDEEIKQACFDKATISVDVQYDNDIFHRPGNTISSWSTDLHTCERFANNNKAKLQDPIAVILHASTRNPRNEAGTFLNINPLYMFRGLWNRLVEKEVLALKDPRITAISFTDWNVTGFASFHSDLQGYVDPNAEDPMDEDWLPF
jgi:hypothetical protein